MSAWVPTAIATSPLASAARESGSALAAVTQRHPVARSPSQRRERREVLLGEELGRRHEGALQAALERQHQRRARRRSSCRCRRRPGAGAASAAARAGRRRSRRSARCCAAVSANGRIVASAARGLVVETDSGAASRSAPRALAQQRERELEVEQLAVDRAARAPASRRSLSASRSASCGRRVERARAPRRARGRP